MTPEEKFNSEVWWILQEIKKESFYSSKPDFRLRTQTNENIPSFEIQRKLLNKLKEWEAIDFRQSLIESIAEKIENANNTDYSEEALLKPKLPQAPKEPTRYVITIHQPKFDEIYEKFRKACNTPSHPYNNEEINKEKINTSLPKALAIEPENYTPATLIANLQRRYDSFISLPLQGFFIGIADYVQYILNNPVFKPIILEIQEEKIKFTENIATLKKQLETDTLTCANDLIQAIEKQNIALPNLSYALEEYKMVVEGKVQASVTQEQLLHQRVEDIINVLFYKGYKDLVKKYIVEDNEGHIRDYNISSAYNDYLELEKLLRERKKIALWGAWNDLVLVYAVVHNYQEETKPENNLSFFTRLDLSYLHDDWEKVVNAPHVSSTLGRTGFFSKDVFTTHISRIHNFIVETLQKVPATQTGKTDIETDAENTGTWKDDFHWVSDIKFNLGNGKSVAFTSPIGQRTTVFKTLTDAKGKWVKVSDIAKKIKKRHGEVRAIITQINEEKLSKENVIKIIPRKDTQEAGAYRIILC